MKPPSDRFVIFVVCDSPAHSRAQAVTNFVWEDDRTPGKHWDEHYPGRRQSGSDSAVTLVDNQRPSARGEMPDFEDREYWARSRAVYELECRKCRRPHQWRLERLFAVLDQTRDEYISSYGNTPTVLPMSLRALSAMIASLPGT